jgi:HD-like signal output (HDOD) protein
VNLSAEQELLQNLSQPGFTLVPRQAWRRALELAADEAAHDDLLIDQIAADARLEFAFLLGASLPAFGDVQLAGTVRQAVGRLGRRKIGSLLWLTALADLFLADRSLDRETGEDFLRHALLTGLIGRQLQAAGRIETTDDLLIAGVAHNIGGLLVALATPRLTVVGGEEIAPLLPDADHLGGLLLKIWNAPPAAIACARHWRNPEEAGSEYRPLLALVRLAERLANILESDNPLAPLHVETLPEWQELAAHVPPKAVAGLANATLHQLPEVILAANHLVAALGG